jgi:hypothetical protein
MKGYEIDYNGDRRERQPPVPDNLEEILNKAQMSIMQKLQQLNWKLWFVRRSVLHPVMAVMMGPNNVTAILEEDGMPNINHGLQFRA